MSELLRLAERVESATGADHTLDGDIAVALGLYTPAKGVRRGDGINGDRWFSEGHPFVQFEASHYTASLDAVLALVAEKLPGWGVLLASHPRTGSVANLAHHPLGAVENLWSPLGAASTPALALLAATLRALDATHPTAPQPTEPA